MEQRFYKKVVMIRRKDLKITRVNKNKNKVKLKFQGQSARRQRWFGIDFYWIEVNFSIGEPEF